jgi:hypothetical protein
MLARSSVCSHDLRSWIYEQDPPSTRYGLVDDVSSIVDSKRVSFFVSLSLFHIDFHGAGRNVR